MKLIFKIYKKVRGLKAEERRLIRDLKLGRELYRYERHCESKNAKDYFAEMQDEMKIRNEFLDKRERELNNLQEKINDQILKLGIVNGVNK
jgi:hypothetical protein